MTCFIKSPHARLDYSIDWAAGFSEPRLIASSEWSVEPLSTWDDDCPLSVAADGHDDRRASASFEGGLGGRRYAIVNRVVFADGDEGERALTVRVEHR